MAFEVNKVGKLQDQFEEQAYEWVLTDIQEQYGVETPDELTGEQVDEIVAFLENDDPSHFIEDYCRMALRTIVDNWEDNQQG